MLIQITFLEFSHVDNYRTVYYLCLNWCNLCLFPLALEGPSHHSPCVGLHGNFVVRCLVNLLTQSKKIHQFSVGLASFWPGLWLHGAPQDKGRSVNVWSRWKQWGLVSPAVSGQPFLQETPGFMHSYAGSSSSVGLRSTWARRSHESCWSCLKSNTTKFDLLDVYVQLSCITWLWLVLFSFDVSSPLCPFSTTACTFWIAIT